MTSMTRWFFSAACSLAVSAVAAAPQSGLDVRLATTTPVLRGDVDVTVTVTVNNPTRHPIQVLKWQLPSDDEAGALFRIVRDDGAPVRYLGAIVKRAAPQAQDRVKLEPGSTLSWSVELTADYDLSRNGRYSVEYASRGAHGPQATELRSAPLYLWLEGRSAKAAPEAAAPPAPAAPTVTYASCSATQQTQLVAAAAQATSYAGDASNHLAGTASATPRYTEWFGATYSTGWPVAKAHFAAIHAAFTTQNLAYNCKCKKPSTYAYVYPNQPYTIYLCGAFWKAPLAGTDSRGGTLVHEMSHFTAVAGTDDWAYGQTAARSLALSDPTKALDNADSHEYFAENTPALP